MMKKYKVWAVAVLIAAIASGLFPDLAKADGCVGQCKIDRQPPSKPSCEATDDCKSSQPGSLYDEIYSKHKPYCGYLRKHRHHSHHWSEYHDQVGSLEDSSSEETAWEWEGETREDLVASTEGYSNFSTSNASSYSSRYSRSDAMGGEDALVLFLVILLWFGLRSSGGKKDSK